MTPTELLLTALLSLFTPPADIRARLDARHARIVADVTAAADHYELPAGLLLVTGFAETHLGADRGEGGGYGSPVDARHRHRAGGALAAARDLATSYRVCGTWLAAVRRYRSGDCRREPRRGYTARFAVRAARRIYERAGLDVPDALRATVGR